MNDSAHWLEGVLEKAGKTTGGTVSLSSSLSLAEAWQEASEATGIHQSELADLVALFFHLPRADLNEVEGKALRLVPETLAKKHQVLPLLEDYGRLVVATADPTNLEAEQAVGFASGRGISLVVASHAELEEAILAQYTPDRDVARILFQVQPQPAESPDNFRLIEEDPDPTPSLEEAGTGPLIDLTNVILKEAVESGASEIQLQPMPHGGVIRYRIDGVLRNSGNMPLSVLARVVSRIKIMARLDAADRLWPQDGRAKVVFGDRQVDLGISTVPTRDAEKMVIRILGSQEAKLLVEEAEEELDVAPPILIVDDDGASRTVARALLEGENHRVLEARDGVEAMELLRSGQAFSLVVLDLEMPRMGGREVLREIRGSIATVGLPVIVLTGTTDPDADLTLMEEGADDYIRKPFDPRRFTIRVKAALRRAGA